MTPKPINNAVKSDQYKEGYKAYIYQVERSANPYRKLTYKFSEWDRGWFTSQQNVGRRAILTPRQE